ncbi:hypothetical protein GP644_21470 [Parasedimentitalea maritima]|uniref:Uncharacterized protein n=1 Tax=Parasedimentitalea maritima TaxID=2578117 RepID=A0A6A4RA66_9RHOB|nr:hypothetical protein GP644_21470 [Zongyanglinia marina]
MLNRRLGLPAIPVFAQCLGLGREGASKAVKVALGNFMLLDRLRTIHLRAYRHHADGRSIKHPLANIG